MVQNSIKVVAPVAFLLRLFAGRDLHRGRRYQKQPQLLFSVRGLQILETTQLATTHSMYSTERAKIFKIVQSIMCVVTGCIFTTKAKIDAFEAAPFERRSLILALVANSSASLNCTFYRF